jgi:hypothetical protein
LKKHLNYVHRNEFNTIVKRYPRRNFFDVYKILLVDASEFPFIQFKQDYEHSEAEFGEEGHFESEGVSEFVESNEALFAGVNNLETTSKFVNSASLRDAVINEEVGKMNEMIGGLSRQLVTLQQTLHQNMSQFMILNDMYQNILAKQSDLIKMVSCNVDININKRYEKSKGFFNF